LTCREDDFESLLGLLARHAVDVLITDAPVPPGSAVRAYNHLLGESTVTLLAPSRHAPSLRRGFPRSLDGAPLLLPLPGSVLRRDLDAFFAVHDVHPVIRAEAEDSALLKAFATEGMGALFVPTVIAKTVARQHDLTLVCELPTVRERYYAISGERRLAHPAVVKIRAAARSDIFA
jgi:LysR family transcriptional activator of nhaA